MFVAANSLLTTPVNPEADESNNIFGFQNTANEQEGPHNETPKFKAINYKIMPSKKHKRDWEILLEDFVHQREQVVSTIQSLGLEEEFREHFNNVKFSAFEQLGDAIFGKCALFKSLYSG